MIKAKIALNPGDRFGRLVLLRRAESIGKPEWLCQCDCGQEKRVPSSRIRNGSTRSCGCIRREAIGIRNLRHGYARHSKELQRPEYEVWRSMLKRCYRQSCNGYERYGGSGITVCEEWRTSFDAFIRDIGDRPSPQHSLGRINNDLGYFPGNVRWETRLEQGRNKRTNHWIEYAGNRKTVSEWARDLGMSVITLQSRIRKGWSVERALSTPVRRRRPC